MNIRNNRANISEFCETRQYGGEGALKYYFELLFSTDDETNPLKPISSNSHKRTLRSTRSNVYLIHYWLSTTTDIIHDIVNVIIK